MNVHFLLQQKKMATFFSDGKTANLFIIHYTYYTYNTRNPKDYDLYEYDKAEFNDQEQRQLSSYKKSD